MEISAPAATIARRVGRRYLASVALILGCAIAGLVALCTAFAWPGGSMVAAQPAAASTGDLQWIRLFGVVQGIAFAIFAVAVVIVRRMPPRTSHVVLLGAVIQLLPLMAPLMLSTDAYSYWNAGRLVVFDGANPYVDAPAAIPGDPSFPFTPPEWRDRTTVYGPVFTGVSGGVAAAVGDMPQLAAWIFRAMAAGSMVALILLVSRIAKRGAFAAAFVGWNPVFAIQFAGSGHNDVLVVTLVVVALWYLERRNVRVAGGLWTLSIFIKWLPLILVPLQVLEDRARGRPSMLPSFAVAMVLVAVASTAWLGPAWLSAFSPVVESAAASDLNSLAIWPRLGSRLPDVVVKLGPLVGFAIAYLLLLRQAWRGRARRGLAMGLFLVASPFLWTWYVITPAVLSAIEDDAPALWIAFALCAYTGSYLGVNGSILRVFLG